MNRVAEVNRELKRIYGKGNIILTAGRDYYYFRGELGYSLESVYVYRASSLSLADWLDIVAEEYEKAISWGKIERIK